MDVGEPDEVVEVAPSMLVVVWPGPGDPVVRVVFDPSPVQAAATSATTSRRVVSRRTIRSQVIGGPRLDLTLRIAIDRGRLVPFQLMVKRMATLAVTVAMVVAACGGEQGSGTLEAVIEPEGETSGFGNFSTGPDKSFGVFVCTRDGSVEIESVEPLHTEGEIEYLGTTVYTSEGRFVGATHGYPPDGIDQTKLSDLEGAVVDADCSDSGGEKVQLIFGAERTGIRGGVLDGFLVTYDGGELEIPFTILLCGDAMEFCEALVPATTTTAPEEG